jgi:folate-binding protein YgfZ
VTEGRAELGDGETLWLEANAGELNGVSFTKGCYVGQENTARMHHRAKVNRRLVVAPLSEPGDRTRVRYPDLGLMVELRRVENLGDALRPAWLEARLV